MKEEDEEKTMRFMKKVQAEIKSDEKVNEQLGNNLALVMNGAIRQLFCGRST